MTRNRNRDTLYRSEVPLPNVIAAVILTPQNTMVRATCNTSTNNYAITLPPPGQCRGLFFSIFCILAANSKAITLQDGDDSLDWSDLTLDTTNDAVLLWSDGQKWWPIVNEIA